MGVVIDNKNTLFIRMNDINRTIINFNLVNCLKELNRQEPSPTNNNIVCDVYYIDIYQIKNTHNLKYVDIETRDNDMIKLNNILNII